jgi:hypothetical protein
VSKFTVAGALCGIFLSTYCTAREFTPCQIADSGIRATISSDEVITIRGKVAPTMHSGVFLHDDACDAHSIKLVSLSNDKSVSVAVDAIITEEMYGHSRVALATGRLRSVGTSETLETTSVTMEQARP